MAKRRILTRIVNFVGRTWQQVAPELQEIIHKLMEADAGGTGAAAGDEGEFQYNNSGDIEGADGVTFDPDCPGAITLTQGTLREDCPYLNHTATWNNSAVNFNGIKSNVTSTASGDDSKLLDLQVNGTSRMYVGKEVAADNATHFLQVVGTLPTTMTNFNVDGVLFNITSAGSDTEDQYGTSLYLNPGYMGGGSTYAGVGVNTAAGTDSGAVSDAHGNHGLQGTSAATTTGNNYGVHGLGGGGNRSFGVVGIAKTTKNSATNIGVAGFGRNTGITPVEIGGYFGLETSNPTFTSAALIADNGSTTNPIARFRNNGTDQVKIGDGVPNDNSQHFLEVVGTLPASPSTAPEGIVFNLTTAGSSSNGPTGVVTYLNSGYTGSSFTGAQFAFNFAAGTGTDIFGGSANYALLGQTLATTTGTNHGLHGEAHGGNISLGVAGRATVAKNSATNIGVAGFGRNTGTTPVEIGGYFGLNTSNPTFESAALCADNAAVAQPIILARDNGTTVWSIQDAGHVYGKMATKTLTEATFTAFVRISVPQSTSVAGKVKYQIQANDATDFQSRSGELHFTAVNKAGTETVTLSTPGAETEVFAESAVGSTLTNTFDTVTGTDTFDIRANATSSLTQTTLRINYTVDMWSNSAVAVTPQ